MIETGLNKFWHTPVYKTNVKFPDEMVNYLLTTYSADKNVSANVSGGNLFEDTYLINYQEFIKPVFSVYAGMLGVDLQKKDYDLRAWLTGYGTGYAMPKHNHSGSHISAVFYLLVDEKGGDLILHDPRTNANRGYKDELQSMFEPIRFSPKSGDIIMFPSYLYHSVESFNGKIRLAMPIDLILY